MKMNQTRWSVLAGTGLALITAAATLLLPLEFSRDLHLAILSLIGGAYIGFAVRDGAVRAKAVEFAGVAFFVSLALAGKWFSPWFWVIGYGGHGLWDLWHHSGASYKAKVTYWYIPFCAVYDVLVSVFLTGWILWM